MALTHIPTDQLLGDEMLARFDERAARYDRENRFFDEDFSELQRSGYLLAAVPTELGGFGLPLSEVAALQGRLAYHAPATALAVNMHLYWTGVASDLRRFGDDSLTWLLEEAAGGHVFASGHGERGNDVPLLLSTASAVRAAGGWRISGHKIFGSLSPVWTYLGVHAMDSSDPSAPRIVHAFVSRASAGYRIEETWDVMGMRGTASHDTILEDVFVPDHDVAVVCPAGFAGAGIFHLSVFAWGMLGFAAVYLGLARRAYDLVVSDVQDKSSIALPRSFARHPGVQSGVAAMRMKLEAAGAYLDRTCVDWSTGVDHGSAWTIKLLSTKHTCVESAWQVVDTAMDLSGGGGIFRRNRMEQIFRDARLGRIHPGNGLFSHEIVGKLSLGIDPDEQPRWG